MGIFAANSVFFELSEEEQKTLSEITQVKNYSKGEIIFHEGEPGRGLHFVMEGAVKIVKVSKEGREHIIHILGPGDLFAEVLLFQEGVYPATSIAQGACKVGVMANTDLEKLVLQNNHLALALIKALSKRLQVAQQKIRNLALSDAAEKIISTFLQLIKEKGEVITDKSVKIYLPMPRQDLANLAGVSRETLARIMAEWQDEGWLTWEGKYLIIKDTEILDRY